MKRLWCLLVLLAVFGPVGLVIGRIYSQRHQDIESLKQRATLVREDARGPDWFTKMAGVDWAKRLLGRDFSHITLRQVDETAVRLVTQFNPEFLQFRGGAFSDEWVRELGKLKSLERLEMVGVQITEDQRDRLQRALPNCRIIVWEADGR